MKCKECDTQNQEEAKFCHQCGAKLEEKIKKSPMFDAIESESNGLQFVPKRRFNFNWKKIGVVVAILLVLGGIGAGVYFKNPARTLVAGLFGYNENLENKTAVAKRKEEAAKAAEDKRKQNEEDRRKQLEEYETATISNYFVSQDEFSCYLPGSCDVPFRGYALLGTKIEITSPVSRTIKIVPWESAPNTYELAYGGGSFIYGHLRDEGSDMKDKFGAIYDSVSLPLKNGVNSFEMKITFIDGTTKSEFHEIKMGD